MDSLKSETQEFSSSHGQWATLRRGYNFMDHEDELTKKTPKICESILRRGEEPNIFQTHENVG